jgi:hypothetical protein
MNRIIATAVALAFSTMALAQAPKADVKAPAKAEAKAEAKAAAPAPSAVPAMSKADEKKAAAD